MSDVIDLGEKREDNEEVKLRLKGRITPVPRRSQKWMEEVEYHTNKIKELMALIKKDEDAKHKTMDKTVEMMKILKKKLDNESARRDKEKDKEV